VMNDLWNMGALEEGIDFLFHFFVTVKRLNGVFSYLCHIGFGVGLMDNLTYIVR